MAEAPPTGFDAERIRAKYLAERDRRLVPGRAAIRELSEDQHFASYRRDPFTPVQEREPVRDEVDAVVLGGGIAGVVAGANLRKAGVQSIRIVDQAGGIGGTWYWNRYPGVMCDVESYVYLPMLEELDYIPTRRYAFGEEIRTYLQRLAEHFDLVDGALFHTGVTRAEWDDSIHRWRITTDRGDSFTCRYYVVAPGILNLMKLPAIPGMEDFQGDAFHTARWDYSVTGGAPGEPMTKLKDKVVGLIGTGATGIQCLGPLAEAAKHVYVFQRTPSAIGVRGNRPTEPEFAASLKPGWQQERMDNLQAVILGKPVEVDLIDDGWTRHYAAVQAPPPKGTTDLAAYGRRLEELDYRIMEEHRARVMEIVKDPVTADILKPYYRYLCKRPCFHDEYLHAYNSPNVTLIDCPSGFDRVSERGPVIDGVEYPVDLLVYGTGFEAELTPLPRRAGHEVVGRGGRTLAEKWGAGAKTLYGLMMRGFPNMFVMPAPGQQSVVTVNYTHLAVLGGEILGRLVTQLREHDAEVFEVAEDAENAWTDQILAKFVAGGAVLSACTPSRINNEGDPGGRDPHGGNFGGGQGDYFAYRDLIEDWLSAGTLRGLELTRSRS
ncbi:MAG TPA: NAD(P)/FAD-dependent oxidoreductase [Mycobacteriales bacterium]|nr:NAD(P)/FAD-dependent oxidoreductase [Mycobacteriales bacterium]